ncbi:unnamed protein product [Owenia fusiformis]|uniref:Centromere/kinetochore protein zw10 homolog n=1 Tax=Owenia fusiformis TaxID=6347 RepID=A0A8J1U374_OWEFU|nr:unnamed protein product [Owenia fusiformis]
MASFVTEVLATAGQLEKQDITSKLGRLSKRIEEVKAEVYDSLQKHYGDFYPNLDATIELSSKVNAVSNDMQTVTGKIERELQAQLNLSTSEFHDLSTQLEETNGIVAILDKLVVVHDALHAVDIALQKKEFILAVTNLNKIDQILETSTFDRENEIKIIKSLHTEHRVQSEKLKLALGEAWQDNVVWTIPLDHDSESVKKAGIFLKFLTTNTSKNDLKNVVQAMNDVNILKMKLKSFASKLMEHVIDPVIKYKNADIKIEKSDHSISLQIQDPKDLTIASPEDVAKKLDALFSFISEGPLGIPIENVEGQDAKCTSIRILGQIMADELIEKVIKQCLANAIPTNRKDLDSFSSVIDTTECFQGKLIAINFIDASNKTLSEYVNEINVLFANKKCQEILDQARELMKLEIHNMVPISPDDPLGALPPPSNVLVDGKTKTEINLPKEAQLSTNTFKMPKCYISQSVQKIMILAYETLQEASVSSPECAVQLFYSIRNMFELYCCVVPTYHKDSLVKLPQIAALHHNNCLYIAHHLMTLGFQFKLRLPKPLNSGASTFVDMVPKLRRLGAECFMEQMSAQRTVLLEYIQGAKGFDGVADEQNFMAAERAIKQCLHQLQHVSKVWNEVLPVNIYSKSMGTLLNTVISEIIGSVTQLEDISAEDATQLHMLLTMIGDRGLELFKFTGEEEHARMNLNKSVQKWQKFMELMLVLNASLHDIADRWTDGKGPLAHEFSAGEIKQLIRALFQNTDRRSAILAKIK